MLALRWVRGFAGRDARADEDGWCVGVRRAIMPPKSMTAKPMMLSTIVQVLRLASATPVSYTHLRAHET